ncbi:RNA-binding domain-containing protein [Rhizoclosmatium globosum]|uniref:RNA-binding domain-containing protein n=1 Tax=Rhizoclosmatium globosum TaxID=329046 RepID=A0A1Y2C3N4_9FUNG|nr:RNA-binding domain-containing protein [Rhizoclosmatium globosum]|eukprot:ORY41639.1 RNA-binding domain-containing protein [Rhizoclosmatium globosum]
MYKERDINEGNQQNKNQCIFNESDETLVAKESETVNNPLVSNNTDPAVNQPEACLFIASLSTSVSESDLQNHVIQHFSKWGALTNVKVLKDWLARPYAFVQYENIDDAKAALLRAHNTLICGRYIRVEQAKVNRTLFLGRLAQLGMSELKSALEAFGPVEDLNILTDYRTGRSKGCGFVKFRLRDDAIKAFLGIRQKYSWTTEWATNLDRNKPEIDLKSIFIGQLNQYLVTDSMLSERFGKYGPIKSSQVVNKAGEGPARPAFAFVTYEDESSAEKAIENENATLWLERTIRVQYREIGEFKGLSRTMKQQLATGESQSATKHFNHPQSSSNSNQYALRPSEFPVLSKVGPTKPSPATTKPTYQNRQNNNTIPRKYPQNRQTSSSTTTSQYNVQQYYAAPGTMIPSPITSQTTYTTQTNHQYTSPMHQQQPQQQNYSNAHHQLNYHQYSSMPVYTPPPPHHQPPYPQYPMQYYVPQQYNEQPPSIVYYSQDPSVPPYPIPFSYHIQQPGPVQLPPPQTAAPPEPLRLQMPRRGSAESASSEIWCPPSQMKGRVTGKRFWMKKSGIDGCSVAGSSVGDVDDELEVMSARF